MGFLTNLLYKPEYCIAEMCECDFAIRDSAWTFRQFIYIKADFFVLFS